MSPAGELARECAAAAGNLLLAVPRQALALAQRRRRLAEFQSLRHEAPAALPRQSPPAASIRRLLLSCGDASGEAHAVRLLQRLRERHPGLQAAGFGGQALAAAGVEIWEPLADLNVMGFRDVLARLPLFFRCVRRFAGELQERPPDAVVLIDYPGLNRHLLRIAARAGVPVVDYVAPQLWAWAPWRVRDFRRADRLLTILPFEADWLARRDAAAVFVGHPLGDGLAGAEAAEPPPPDLAEDAWWVGLLPGSRRREIRANLPLLLQAAALLGRERPALRFVLPHVRPAVWPLLREILAASPVPIQPAFGSYHGVLRRLRAAWVASGTALLEVAAHRVPPVLIYRVPSRLADFLRRISLAVPGVGSLNLIAGREIAPEHVGRVLDPARLAADLEALLDGPQRASFLAELEPLLPSFAAPGAAGRAAWQVEQAIAGKRAKKDAPPPYLRR